MTPAGFELTVPANEPPLSHTLDRAAIELGFSLLSETIMPNEMVPLSAENNVLFFILNWGMLLHSVRAYTIVTH